MPLLKKLIWTTGAATAGIGGFILSRPTPAPFHIDVPPVKMNIYGVDFFPALRFVFTNLPESMRQNLVVKMNAPQPEDIQDRFDCTGESPYAIEEIVEEKMWKIKYEIGNSMLLKKGKEQAKALGLDPNSKSYKSDVLAGAAQFGERAVQVALEDIDTAKEWFGKDAIPKADLVKFPPPFSPLNSFVIKLRGGSLLLYAPVKVREETGFAEWLDSLGNVEWIVVASSAHTLCLPSVIDRYPHAKIIGPPHAEAKLNFVSALPRRKLDFDSTNAADLAAANAVLQPEGVKLYNVNGDACTNALVAVLDDTHLMSCDLIYTHADGEGFLTFDKERFRKFLPEDWTFRLFRFKLLSKPNSPNGYLAVYRMQLMDRNNLGMMNYNPPAADGSTCKIMANSLRDLLKAPFESANGVHFDVVDREMYADAMDKNWNWLDGHSLISN